MFGRQKRREAQAIEAIREQVSNADLHARAVLADAIAQMELRVRELEQREQPPPSGNGAGPETQVELGAGAADLARALEQVANMCALVADRLEDDQLERRALTDALARLARPASAALDVPARTIGGTVYGAPAAVNGAEIPPVPANGAEISLLDDAADDEDDDDDEDDGELLRPVPYAEAPTENKSDYVLTVLERLTDVVYRRRERETRS